MKRQSNSTTGDFERKKLDVNLLTILAIALVMTLAIYLIVFPFKTSFIGILLYDRGYTQHLAIYFACIVVSLNILKFNKLQKEFRVLKRFWIPDTILFDDPEAKEIINLQKTLAKEPYLVAIRCSRVIAAYIQSANRKNAAELALDDSSFYISASESSYTFPRILIWAIPLLGFIGTVFGISEAVNGFSNLLDKVADVEQIKEGIGTVTTGLAIAFDTTLLALLLSVAVMIPLVLIERFETRLLLGIDIFINDQLLPRLRERGGDFDEKTIDRAIDRAFKEHLPNSEALIEPARVYAEKAAASLAQNFVAQVSKLQEVSHKLIEQIGQVNELAIVDRQSYTNALEKQQATNQNFIAEIHGIIDVVNTKHSDSLAKQHETHQNLIAEVREIFNSVQTTNLESLDKQKQTHQNLIAEIRGLIETVKVTHLNISKGFVDRTQQISQQLDRASTILESRIASLEQATVQITEIAKLQQSIEEVLSSLENTQLLNQSLLEVKESLMQLKPALEKMSKPRMITFVDSDEGDL
ncbi:MAG: MotA/TolQ/ExbB proton channel family protein [Hydrococcus sp. Prado102]|jgi:biopolymer transport protein ExbB/TolQ|nr:MotA/TolQ/ExbB proton channel family protein [Hydrococcus sp. Prado102]